MSSPERRPSLQTLAKALGLSTATVSNAYNRPDVVTSKTRDRVLAKAQELGYSGPNPAGRQLRRGRTEAIGLIFTDEMSFAFQDQASVGFLQGLAIACANASRNLLLLPAGPPHAGLGLGSFASAAVDGFVIYSVPDKNPYLQSALDRNIPAVVVDQPRHTPADWVGINDREAARNVARHLADLGHRRIGVITSRLGTARHNGRVDQGRWKDAGYVVQRERLWGLVEGFSDVGIGADDLVIEERYEATEPAGASALNALLGRDSDLTAVCALADVLALGAMDAALHRGLTIPNDLSITGFDDVPAARAAGLTTVSQPLIEKGRVAGEMLIRRIDAADRATKGAEQRLLTTSLIVRNSTSLALRSAPAL
ncbi:hypothetical protein ASF98_00120 [Arthrobacter sp. Leaf337]|uniref:LacI family DNA-binding transcriptional regulator n=1 Tax=Arthrobacter sp. Leaf337 TaxID=1736342 RepID=UPI0007000982|nr:LacI family DNA-binding transcriptional regulator [Arthrobacter sp. Leaf337]KQR82469.1 hypothetical protein ASF98_00120 [Arthrobacter sp. Leaf337]